MAVESLFVLCLNAMFVSTMNFQSACIMLPPKLLHYLLYKAVVLENKSWIQGLVRYWPLETLSFDFDEFIDYTNIRDRSESYLRKDHSWHFSYKFPQMKLRLCVLDSIATGLYLRAYHCHQNTPGNKQFIVDLTMVEMEWVYLSMFYIVSCFHTLLWFCVVPDKRKHSPGEICLLLLSLI